MTTARLSSAQLDPVRLTVWIVIAIAVPYVLVLGGTLSFIALPEGRIVMQALTLAAGAAGLILAARRPDLLRSPVVVAGAVYVLVVIAAALVSQRPAPSMEATALIVIAAPCYLAIRAVAWDEPLITRIRWLIVVSAFLVLIPYLVEVLAAWADWWQAFGLSLPPIRPGNPSGTVGSSNALATYTYLLVPYAAWAAWSLRRGRIVAAVLVGGALFALVTSGSRGAWLGALAGIIVGSLMIAADRGGVLRRLSLRQLVLALGAGAFVVAVTSPWIAARVAAGDAGRYEIWSAALSIFSRFPVLGTGPGSWQGMRPMESITWADTASILTPHQSLLYVGSETGVVGLIAAGLLVGAVVWVAWRAYASQTHGRRVEVAVIVGSLLGVAVHSLFDPQFMLAAVMLMTMFLVARLDGPIVLSADPRRRAWWPVTVAASAMVAASLLMIRIDSAMLDAQAGLAAIDRGDWPAALPALDRAAEGHDLGSYELGRAIALSRLGRPVEAAEALERQATTDPLTSPQAAAAVLIEAEDQDRAISIAEHVRAAGAYDPTATLNAAGVLDRRSDPAAVEMVADVVVQVPFLRLNPIPAGPVSKATWTTGIDRAIGRLEGIDPLAAANVALESGDAGRAMRLTESAREGPERTVFEAYLAAVGGSSPDLGTAREAVRIEPTERAITWYARLATIADSASGRAEAEILDRLLFRGALFDALVVDLSDDATRTKVARVLSYPGASYRIGPHRPYVAGMATLAYEPWSP